MDKKRDKWKKGANMGKQDKNTVQCDNHSVIIRGATLYGVSDAVWCVWGDKMLRLADAAVLVERGLMHSGAPYCGILVSNCFCNLRVHSPTWPVPTGL